MDKVANYLWKAAELERRAGQAKDQGGEHAYTAMAEAYRKLANHVERRVITLQQRARIAALE
jgi:hypothetical protein